MKAKLFSVGLIGFLVGLVVMGLWRFPIHPKVTTECPKPSCPSCPSCPDYDLSCPSCPEPRGCDCPELSSIKQVAKRVANSREYEKEVYDCSNFSEELRERLVAMGYERANIMMTEVDCSDGWNCTGKANHEFVLLPNVYIEATTGDIIEPTDYQMYNLGEDERE